MGSDLIEELGEWKNASKIARMAEIICVMRPGSLEPEISDRTREMGFKIHYLPTPGLDISSTMIKEKIDAGESLEGLVPGAAEDDDWEE